MSLDDLVKDTKQTAESFFSSTEQVRRRIERDCIRKVTGYDVVAEKLRSRRQLASFNIPLWKNEGESSLSFFKRKYLEKKAWKGRYDVFMFDVHEHFPLVHDALTNVVGLNTPVDEAYGPGYY